MYSCRDKTASDKLCGNKQKKRGILTVFVKPAQVFLRSIVLSALARSLHGIHNDEGLEHSLGPFDFPRDRCSEKPKILPWGREMLGPLGRGGTTHCFV